MQKFDNLAELSLEDIVKKAREVIVASEEGRDREEKAGASCFDRQCSWRRRENAKSIVGG